VKYPRRIRTINGKRVTVRSPADEISALEEARERLETDSKTLTALGDDELGVRTERSAQRLEKRLKASTDRSKAWESHLKDRLKDDDELIFLISS
tara:strand:- start:224 stop:508 length:285 start_codon:yes stop_codon:yes gene_type:complete